MAKHSAKLLLVSKIYTAFPELASWKLLKRGKKQYVHGKEGWKSYSQTWPERGLMKHGFFLELNASC